jgi:hypothetical protein
MRERTPTPGEVDAEEPGRELDDLLTGPVTVHAARTRIDGVLIGRLVAFTDDGTVPLVTYQGQPGTAALRARATLDLHGAHIGGDVVLMFENADPESPIIVGRLYDPLTRALRVQPGNVEMEVDGERMVVTAKEQLVLKCGKARITLTRAGKVLIEGAFVSNRSSGVLRLKGGSVQIN